MKKLLKNRLIVSLLVVLCLTILGLSGIRLVNYISDKKEEQFLKELDEAEPVYFGDVDPEIVKQVENGTFEVPEIIPGKYYLNGDINSYYFWIRDDSTIELCCDDKYSLFKSWNPEYEEGNTQQEQFIIAQVEAWEEPRPYTIEVSVFGTVMLRTDSVYNENGLYLNIRGGPCYIDEKTIGKWGIEGDFIRVDDPEDSLSDGQDSTNE